MTPFLLGSLIKTFGTLNLVFIKTTEKVVAALDGSRTVLMTLGVAIGIWTSSTNFS